MVNFGRISLIAATLTLTIGAILVALLPSKRSYKPKRIDCSAMSYEERLSRDEVKHSASPNVGGMGMYHYEITHQPPPGSGFKPRKELVHATVALWTPHGRLLGSDRGEFGGELVLDREEHPPTPVKIIFYSNIEDLFLMKYGVLATTGYFHLDQDFGSIFLVTFSDSGEPKFKEIFKLPGGVVSSWVTEEDKLLVNTNEGSFAISSPTQIEPVVCKSHWWQIT